MVEQFKPAPGDSHYLVQTASHGAPVSPTQLSHIVERMQSSDPARLTVNLAHIQTIDQLPSRFHSVTSLHLSNTQLTSLRGIQQFPYLTHLILSHNLIHDVSELDFIQSPERLLVLSVQGNPVAADPDLIPLCLRQFPK